MSRKILVIDDEPLILKTVDKALTKIGYTVLKAQNMSELEDALKQSPYDLLLTDLNMEEDSAENIIDRVTCQSPGIKVLMMSGATYRIKTDNFIEKPFTLEELREKVRVYLNEPS